MAKTKNTEAVMIITPELERNIDILQAFKSQVDVIGNNCQQIQVVDEVSLAIGQQNLSKANNLLTSIEEKRVAIKAPYLDSGKLIDSTAKILSEELSKGIKHIKEQVGEWEKKRLAEAAAKQAEIDKQLADKAAADKAEEDRKATIRSYIKDKATPTLQKMYADCTSVEICDAKLSAIENNYKSREFFAEYVDEAYTLRDNYIDLIKAKKQQLLAASTMSEAEIELALEKEAIAIEKANMALRESELKAKEETARLEKEAKEAEAAAELEKQRLAQEAKSNKTRGIRYTWTFELNDIKAVPLDWLTLDEAKVKEWLKSNKESLKDGDIMDGVKFIKKMGINS